MADTDAYRFPDASEADQQRYLDQQLAESIQARRITEGDRSVESHPLKELDEVIERRRQRKRGAGRMFTVLTKHSRR